MNSNPSNVSYGRNTLGKILALCALVATGIWLGRIYTGGSYCPVAMLAGHCPFDSNPVK